VGIAGVGVDNLGKEVECLQLFGHEEEDMAGSYFGEMGSNYFDG